VSSPVNQPERPAPFLDVSKADAGISLQSEGQEGNAEIPPQREGQDQPTSYFEARKHEISGDAGRSSPTVVKSQAC